MKVTINGAEQSIDADGDNAAPVGTATAGALVGLLVFSATRRVLASWLFDITPGDPRVISVTLAILVFVAASASWIPARRATRIDLTTSLRPG